MPFSGGRVVPDHENVGVVDNIKPSVLRHKADPTVYMPHSRAQRLETLWFFVAAKSASAELGPGIRRIVRELEANLPVWGMVTSPRGAPPPPNQFVH